MSGPQPNQHDKVYLETAHASIRWNSEGPWVAVEWKAFANASEFKTAYEIVLVAIRENRATSVLIDVRDARVIPEEDQRWLIENWIPRAVAAGRRWTAIVMPKSALVKTIVENIDKRRNSEMEKVRYFGTPEEAAVWLSGVS